MRHPSQDMHRERTWVSVRTTTQSKVDIVVREGQRDPILILERKSGSPLSVYKTSIKHLKCDIAHTRAPLWHTSYTLISRPLRSGGAQGGFQAGRNLCLVESVGLVMDF